MLRFFLKEAESAKRTTCTGLGSCLCLPAALRPPNAAAAAAARRPLAIWYLESAIAEFWHVAKLAGLPTSWELSGQRAAVLGLAVIASGSASARVMLALSALFSSPWFICLCCLPDALEYAVAHVPVAFCRPGSPGRPVWRRN